MASRSLDRPSWNPLRCSGTALPVPLLLMAKLIAVSLLLTNHVRLLQEPFLAFVPQLENMAAQAAFLTVLRAMFVISAVTLILNRKVRLSSFLLGATIILAVISSKAYYGNNKLFCGVMLLLTGLYQGRLGAWLLRLQMAVVYFGAGLNKLLDADWQSGVFFDHWAGKVLGNSLYLWAAPLLPAMLLAKLVCWATIATELGLAAAFLVRRAWPWAIWVSLLFHAALLEFTGSTFTMFFYAMQAAMLLFVEWPWELVVIYDGDCGICNKIRRWWQRLDFDRAFQWEPLQSGVGGCWGIARAALEEKLHVVTDGRISSGFRACKRMLLYHPLTYFLLAVLIAAPPAEAAWYRRVLVALAIAFFFPLFEPVGEAVYNYVARNRYLFSGEGACAVDAKQ